MNLHNKGAVLFSDSPFKVSREALSILELIMMEKKINFKNKSEEFEKRLDEPR